MFHAVYSDLIYSWRYIRLLTFVVGHVSNWRVAGKALALAFVQTSFNPALCKKRGGKKYYFLHYSFLS